MIISMLFMNMKQEIFGSLVLQNIVKNVIHIYQMFILFRKKCQQNTIDFQEEIFLMLDVLLQPK